MTTKGNELQGLTRQQVEQSRREHGANVLTPVKRTSLWKLYLEKYEDPIIRILLVAAAISLVLAFVQNDFVETIGIIVAIFFATTVGFYFERDAAKKFNVLTQMNEEQPVKVVREGRVHQIARREVVVGDIIIVEPGDEVPADSRLLEAIDLEVNESSLTGEMITEKSVSDNAAADAECQNAQEETSDKEENQQTGEKPHGSSTESTYPHNMLLRSSMVMGGRGKAVVTAVGDATEIGKVARTSAERTGVKTPLNQQLDRLAALISKVGMGVSIAAFVLFLGHDLLTDPLWHTDNYLGMAEVVLRYFMMAVTLIVMAVPEGLPMAVTLSLALNMRRMLKSNNLVRKLHACETMGAVTVICTDKTGTLTENRMTVAARTVADGRLGSELLDWNMAVNSTAELDGDRGIGNPTEVALLQSMGTADYRELRRRAVVEAQVPFSTEKKYMQTTAVIDGERYVFVKGAPEIVLGMCETANGQEWNTVNERLVAYQRQAMRTLAFACNGRFQAVVAISDPVRKEVPQAVQDCLKAGIDVKIVTGDTSATAMEIARQIGITGNVEQDTVAPSGSDVSPLNTISGAEFAALTDEEAMECAGTLKVMSRARPSDKQRLVQMLQKRGEIVAVTGDGTNDAPALNHAHVGLSLGSGTSVAKEASDMTLLDDSFRSIVNAVMWGRSLYKNIQRFLFFQLVVNVTALLLVLGGSVIGTELPLTVTQILWVNLIMDTFAAMALASLPPSREVMSDKPRRRDAFIITRQMWRGILGIGILFFAVLFVMFYYYLHDDVEFGVQMQELTIFFTTFVMLQWWNLFNAKTLGSSHSAFRRLYADRGMLLVLAMILVGQWLIVTFGGKMFRTVPLSFRQWVGIIVVTSVVLWVGEIYRAIGRARSV